MVTKFLLLHFCLLLSNLIQTSGRETLEVGIGIGIGIGGGGGGGSGNNGSGCPVPAPPPPPAKVPCPPPPSPPPPHRNPPPPPSPPPPHRNPPPPPSPPPPSPPPPPPRNPPPPPPPEPEILKPSDFLNTRIYNSYLVIQKFRKTITEDRMGITNTWNGPDLCRDKSKYKGFYCDNAPDTPANNKNARAVAAVDFNGYRLGAPSVAEFIEGLKDLAFFHANSNKFRGTITPGIANLPFFYELDVSNNLLSGEFPMPVLGIKNITFFDLRFNSFSGQVPPQLFLNFKLVEVIFINNNGFNQNIPANIGRSPVKYLTLANNQFTGSIPRSIRLASNTLLEVLFLNNQLSGCIPYEVGFLEKATVFDAGYNKLTGPIPYSLGCLKKIEQLNFAGNKLYGQIPEVICKLGSLQNLSLSDNYFTSVGPICRKLIKKGVLDDRKNCILGRPKQRSPDECTAFFSKPLLCPFPSSYVTIPCKQTISSVEDVPLPPSFTDATKATISPSPSPPPSYAALTKPEW
ncbi:uncharacterized protein At4g06744-like [Magnolia sinica]|uniref:uncharacterized protein At4g06744-like n=1 Tax=Magnolia sinica TaxID=86752 RepID=UPI002657BC5A|nr:uncharacterized protein At4g06744-like [Magnolia sinica]